jgi:glycosyltransferase involved in cell wall biosynthesis
MRLLHVIPGVARRYGGPSVAVLEMCRALRARGHDPLIVTTDADGPDRLPVEVGEPIEYEGVRAVFFPRTWSESIKYSAPLARWLGAHIREFDVVHVHALMSHACVAAVRAARAADVPYVLRPLGTLDDWSLAQKPLKKRVFMAGLGRTMLRGAAAVHVTSPDEGAAVATAWNVERVAMIPLGVNAHAFEAARERPADPPYVASLSRVHPVKGLELLVDAFAAVTRDGPLAAWQLHIAGSGAPDDVAALVAHVRNSPAAGRVRLTGWLDGADKDAFLGRASLFALTSRHENFGIGLAEAMARGLPVVASRAVQIAPWIESAGAGWVTPLAPAAIEAALRDAMADPAKRASRGAAARVLAEQWRWPAVAERLEEMYATAGSSNPSHATYRSYSTDVT